MATVTNEQNFVFNQKCFNINSHIITNGYCTGQYQSISTIFDEGLYTPPSLSPACPNFPFHTRCAEENCRGEDHMCLYIFIKKQVTCHMKLRQTGKFKESAISIPSCLEQKITLKMQSVNFHHEPQGWRTKVSYNFLSCVPLRYSTCSPGREPIQVRF